jgi:PAS domain S-box-containing protein
MNNLLNGISRANSILLESGDYNRALHNVVEALGSATDVDRCYIFKNEKDREGILRLYYINEWCNEGIEVQLGNPDLSGHSYDVFPGLYDQLIQNQPMYGMVKDSPNPFFREIMESQGIISYLFVPIFSQNKFWGWMGYDNCSTQLEWTQNEVNVLFTVARNIGLRLSRDYIEQDHLQIIERFNMSAQASQQGLWEWYMDTEKLYFSEIFMKMLGYQHYEFDHSFENWKVRVHPHDIDYVLEQLNLYLTRKKEKYIVQFRLQHKTGNYVWIQSSGIVKRNKDGIPVYMVGSHIDISEIKIQQEQLQKQRNEFNNLINGLGEAVFRLNLDNSITFLNEYWTSLSDYSTKESMQSKIINYFAAKDREVIMHALDHVKKDSPESFALDVRLVRKDLKVIWVQLLLRKYGSEEDNSVFIAGSIINIHEKKLSEEKEKELADMKEHFVSLTSHQFRTPLTVIFSNIELIELYATKSDPKLATRINTSAELIRNEIDRMTDLMNNILLMGRYDAKQFNYNFKKTDCTALIYKVTHTYFSNQTDGRRIHIKVIGKEQKVMLDEMLITHVLTNIISNAFKYSEGAADPQLEVNYLDQMVEIIISDNGIGIPQNEIEKVFNSFYRATNTLTYQGSGLGLVVAKQFLELHNGSIRLYSQLGKGTQAHLTIPYSK